MTVKSKDQREEEKKKIQANAKHDSVLKASEGFNYSSDCVTVRSDGWVCKEVRGREKEGQNEARRKA